MVNSLSKSIGSGVVVSSFLYLFYSGNLVVVHFILLQIHQTVTTTLEARLIRILFGNLDSACALIGS